MMVLALQPVSWNSQDLFNDIESDENPHSEAACESREAHRYDSSDSCAAVIFDGIPSC